MRRADFISIISPQIYTNIIEMQVFSDSLEEGFVCQLLRPMSGIRIVCCSMVDVFGWYCYICEIGSVGAKLG